MGLLFYCHDNYYMHLKTYHLYRYETARGIIDSLFGTRAHGDFPIRRREKDDQCSGSGEYPSRLGSGHTDYKHVGVDILIESGKTVQKLCSVSFACHYGIIANLA